MTEKKITATFSELDHASELPVDLQSLLLKAKEAIHDAYAPYSSFRVGAAALLENGTVVKGSNQENASSPAGICAERAMLSAVSALYPGVSIVAIAITAKPGNYILTEPVAPCGICRQSLLEYEERFNKPIQLVLQGESGKIIWFKNTAMLLPLAFSRANLKR